MGEGRPEAVMVDGSGLRFAIVAARFNGHIVDRLIDGARSALIGGGVAETDMEVLRVPGAFELPAAARAAGKRPGIDGVVALGVVIRGETDHYEYVCQGATYGLMRLSVDGGMALGFGLLTCENEAQALERAGGSAGNKGRRRRAGGPRDGPSDLVHRRRRSGRIGFGSARPRR